MEIGIPNDQEGVIFDRFLKIKLVKCEWVKETHAIVTINDKPPKYFNNEDGKHAEERIVDECLKKSPTNTKAKIVINYSPCAGCSKIINEFLEERSDVKLEIVFAGLYNIDRIVTRPSETINKVPDSTANINGLKDLSRNHVALRNFCPEDWRNLWNTLSLNRMSTDKRSAMWKSILKDPLQTFPKKEEVIKTRLREDAYVKMELEIMLGNDTRNLMEFFDQEPRQAGPPPEDRKDDLVEKTKAMSLKETPKDRSVDSP